MTCCRGASSASAPLPAVHRAAQPRTRLILVLREPAARMHSAFWYYGCMHGLYQRHGLSAAGFHGFAQARRPCRSFACSLKAAMTTGLLGPRAVAVEGRKAMGLRGLRATNTY